MKPAKTRSEQGQKKRPYAEPTLQKRQKLADVVESAGPGMSGYTQPN